LSGYWGYVIYTIGRSVYNTSDPASDGFRQAVLTNGEMAAFYNGIAFLAAFAMVPIARRIGAGPLHALALAAGGVSMLVLPGITDKAMLFAAIVGVGIAWGSIMGNPYVILSNSIPPERVGVYMGIFNMMIVLPMLLFAFVMSAVNLGFVNIGLGFYDGVLGGDPRNVLRVSGVCMFVAALAVLWVREGWKSHAQIQPEPESV
jgi:maltose/moltooligosaccharide transporter